MCECVSSCGTGDFNSAHCPGCRCRGRLMGEIKGTGRGGTTGAKWPALFDGVMQRDISAGSEQVARQLSGGTIPEQRDEETLRKAPLQTT